MADLVVSFDALDEVIEAAGRVLSINDQELGLMDSGRVSSDDRVASERGEEVASEGQRMMEAVRDAAQAIKAGTSTVVENFKKADQ